MVRLNARPAAAAALVWCFLLSPAAVSAQLTRGSIAGTVRDGSGAVVPGAAITVTNAGTNAAHAVGTDRDGAYRVAALEPGMYLVRVEMPGFRSVEQADVPVRSALETPVDVRLEPDAVGETVQVLGDAARAGLNRTSPTTATTLTARQIADLPLASGRDVMSLLLAAPNVLATTGQGLYAVNGNRPRNNNYMVDGSDNNDLTVTVPTSAIVPEAVAELQVLQNPYSVEFGRNSGGQVNVITRSGTNRYAGDVYDYYQASGLNSRTNVEKANGLAAPPKAIRHQLGGALGGPVVADRLFFFGLYQRDSQRRALRPSPTAVTIPTPDGFAALAGVPLGPNQTLASRQAVLRQIEFLRDVYAGTPVFRNVRGVLVNGVPVATGTTNLPISDPSLYHTGFARTDLRAADRDTLTVRYSRNDNEDEGIAALGFGSRYAASQDIVDVNLGASHTHLFSPALLNEARISVVRRDLRFPEADPASPTAAITGHFQIGGNANFPTGRFTTTWQFADTMTWTRGRHTLKAGTDLRHNDVENQTAFHSKGTFTFDSLQDYLNNHASRVQQALQTASWDAGQLQAFFFVQDDVRVATDLTVTLGLRYEVAGVPHGLFGATDGLALGALVRPPVRADRDNWAPRAGFAWSPPTDNWLFGSRQSVLRGGFGVGYDVLFYNLWTANASNYPRVVTLDVTQQQDLYPDRLSGTASPRFDPLASFTNASEHTENPESRFYSLTLQRQLGPYLFEAGYSGSRGAKGLNQILMNPAVLTPAQAALVAATRSATANGALPAAQARRLFPEAGPRALIPAYTGPGGNDTEARSQYDALFVSANRRLADGVQLTASYTWSRWMSNNDAPLSEGGTEGSSQRPQDMFDYEAEWSRSQFDRPHRLAIAYIWEIPAPPGPLGRLLGGWQVSGLTQAQSGRPFTIVTGVDSNGDTNTGSDRPSIDPAGTFVWDARHRTFTNHGYYVVPLGTNNLPLANSLGNGTAGRNTERMAGFWNTDAGLSKRVGPAGTARLTLRLDAFNVFNQDNYGGAPGTLVQSSFGNMSSLNFGANMNDWGRRVLQLSAKITF
jgi:hypothetical protein